VLLISTPAVMLLVNYLPALPQGNADDGGDRDRGDRLQHSSISSDARPNHLHAAVADHDLRAESKVRPW
jgi:hypothetical protein